MAATFKATNQATGLNYRFMRFGEMDDTVTTTYQNVFGTSGKLYSITINNSQGSAGIGLIKFFDTTAKPEVAASVYDISPSLVLPFTKSGSPAGFTAFTQILFPEGLEFSNGVAIAITEDVSASYGIKAATKIDDAVTSVVLEFK